MVTVGLGHYQLRLKVALMEMDSHHCPMRRRMWNVLLLASWVLGVTTDSTKIGKCEYPKHQHQKVMV
jgi:hypothetical protein